MKHTCELRDIGDIARLQLIAKVMQTNEAKSSLNDPESLPYLLLKIIDSRIFQVEQYNTS